MKQRIRILILICLWISCSRYGAEAQTPLNELSISIKLQAEPLSSIFNKLEQQYPRLRIFANPELLPKTPLSISFENTPLSQVLDKLLQNTTLSYFNYRDYGIVIAPRQSVNEVFSANYYQALEQGLNTSNRTETQRANLVQIGDIRQLKAVGTAKLSGKILYVKDQTPIPGATIRVPKLDKGTVSDENGYYELDLPVGKHQLLVQYVGNAEITQDIQVFSDGGLDFVMENVAVNLDEVVVGAQGVDANVDNAQIGVTRLDVRSINKLPAFLGEADVIKSLLLAPGVSSIGEGATGFNVRGGEVDQNLILQDDGMIFNASHALGFFSSFHTDLISRVTLYKSIIPAQYGGRLASVLDVEMRDGDYEKAHIKGGIGPVSSRIAVETPIIPKKASVIAGFRSSYSDWILRAIRTPEVRNSSAFFYDANLRYSHKIGDKNTLILSGYASKDQFNYNQDFGFDYQTTSAQAILKTIFNAKAFSRFSASMSRYASTQFDYSGVDAAKLDNNIEYYSLKEHLTLSPKQGLQLDAGLSSILYLTLPGQREALGANSLVLPKILEKERGLESAIFANAEWSPLPALQISGGLRFAYYQFLGPKTLADYQNPQRPAAQEILGNTAYPAGKTIAAYSSLEPRLSARYRFNAEKSVKLGYSRTAQFINQIFNSASPTPTSIFQLSTPYIQPNRSHNFSVGYFRNYQDNSWETSVEVYGRIIDALFDYQDFALLNVNENLETELLNGTGRAYGLELSLRKKQGLVNGMLSYTLSRTERRIQGINQGSWYPSNFDKPHDLSLVLNYQYNQRHTVTLNFTYGSGRPTTAPSGSFRNLLGIPIPIYSERNALRIPDYHRVDLAYTLGRDHRKNNHFKTSWTFSIYNLYARKNAFAVFFTQTPFTGAQANRLAILGSIFPSITFNFETI